MNLIKFSDILTTCLTEMRVEDPNLQKSIDEFGILSDSIDRITRQLKEMETRYKTLESELRPILEQLIETKEKALVTASYSTTIKRMGYDRTNVKYKEAFELALTKVNGLIKEILKEALKSTESTTHIPSSVSVQPIKENVVNIQKIDQLQVIFDKANSVLAKLASGSI